ncbi:uncharacterized protein LOC130411302 isoform X3 [Triplophysa dalaica]|uniref:uncharacterized protein LOC130411302 isoform X3 n=1 Tax=Triplophysa dalaica TaxID=1582913 RepID=UPI0024E036F0|nr:uncharacterized protein LOC130411302 isoform X3 [Triplophysa dalaica]
MSSFKDAHCLFLVVFSITLCICKGAEFVIRAIKGETVHLPCLSHPYNSYLSSVVWTKNSQTANVICKQTVCENKASSGYCVSPFRVTAFNLNIENVQFSDFGSYTCKWSRIVPPPTLDDITNLTLLVEDLSLEHLYSRNNSCIHLLCTLEALNPEQVNFTWSTDGQRLPHLSSSSVMSSELHLCEPAVDDGDPITCQASYFYNNTLYSINRTVEAFTYEFVLTTKFLVGRVIVYSVFILIIGFIWTIFFKYKYQSWKG